MAILNTRAANYAVADTWADGYTIDAPAAVFAFNTDALVIPVIFADAALGSAVTQAVAEQLIQGTASQLDTAVAVTANTVKINSVGATLGATTAMTTVAGAAVAADVEFDTLFTPTVSVIALRDNESWMQITSTLTVNTSATITAGAALDNTANTATTVEIIRDTSAALTANTTVSAVAGRVHATIVEFSSAFSAETLDAQTIPLNVTLASTTAISAAVSALLVTNSELFAYNNLTVGADLAQGNSADLNTTTALSVAGTTIGTTAELNSTTDLQVGSVLIQTADSTPITTAVLAAVPQRIIFVSADLAGAFNSQLTAGVFRADTYRTIQLTPETRTIAVLSEDRTLVVIGAYT